MKWYINAVSTFAVLALFSVALYIRFSGDMERKIRVSFENKRYSYAKDIRLTLNDSLVKADPASADKVLLALIGINNKYRFVELDEKRFKISNHFTEIRVKYQWSGNQLVFRDINVKTHQKEYCR